jgi:maltose alpha-D-glucosyltransferase / alpha-amylase
VPADLDGLLGGPTTARLTAILPAYLRARRWFRSKSRRIKSVALHDVVPLAADGSQARLAIFDIDFTDGEAERYVLPLALSHTEEAERVVREWPQALVAHVAPEGEEGLRWVLYDALYDPSVATSLLDAIGARRRSNGRRGQVTATPTTAYRRLRGKRDQVLEVSAGRAEQSNTSVTFGDRLILKLFRRLEPGVNPDIEIGEALTELGFEHTPAVAGWLAYRNQGETSALGILQEYVANQGDAWDLTLDAVSAYFERAATVEEPPEVGVVTIAALLEIAAHEPPELAREMIGSYLDSAWLLGARTADLHRALASVADPAFAPEPISELALRSVFQSARNQASESLATLARLLDDLPEPVQPQARAVLHLAPAVHARLRALTEHRTKATRIRVHGDFHAGQVLWTGRDFVIIDFEGEPGRPISERRHKRAALTDVAGMLRSFHYAAFGTLLNPRVGGAVRPEDIARLEPWASFWYQWVAVTYLRGYLEGAAGESFLAQDVAALAALLDVATLQKVLYELSYELNNRPDWVSIPIRGLLEQLGHRPPEAPAVAGLSSEPER